MKRARFRRSCLNTLAGTLAVALMSLFFIFCHDIVIQSPYFKVTDLEVTGNNRLSFQDVLDAARIRPDTNVLQVNLPLAKKYLSSHPWIAEVEITRVLPGKLTIAVKEHQPLAILDLGRKFLVNLGGRIFKELSEADAVDVPIIEGMDFTDLDMNDFHKSTHYESVLHLLEMRNNPACVLANMPFRSIRLDREEGITISTVGPVQTFNINTVKIGYQDFSEKFVRLEKIIAYFRNNKFIPGIDWVDLRQMNRVVISPLNPEPRTDGRKEI